MRILGEAYKVRANRERGDFEASFIKPLQNQRIEIESELARRLFGM